MALGIWQMGVYVPDLGTDVPLPFISTMVLIWCTLTAAALAVYNEVRESDLRTRLERELLSRTKAQEEADAKAAEEAVAAATAAQKRQNLLKKQQQAAEEAARLQAELDALEA